MGLFDTILEAASDAFGDDGDEAIDTFRGWFTGDDDGGSAGGDGGGWLSTVGSSFGDEGDGGDGALGGLVDRLSGDGGREALWDRALETMADRVSAYLPEEMRSVAGQLLGPGGEGQGGRGSSWAGSLVDTGRTDVPDGWQAVGNHPAVGDSFGERGFGGFFDHSIGNLMGHRPGPGTAGEPIGNAATSGLAGHDGVDDGMPDPRVTMPADALGRDRYAADRDGDGHPDGNRYDNRYDGDGDDDRADYDDLVTSGAPAAAPGYEVPDDPTFPADIEPPAPPAADFEQSIDDADQADASLDAISDGLEGLA